MVKSENRFADCLWNDHSAAEATGDWWNWGPGASRDDGHGDGDWGDGGYGDGHGDGDWGGGGYGDGHGDGEGVGDMEMEVQVEVEVGDIEMEEVEVR